MEKKEICLCMMPDESCRNCGKELKNYQKCSKCNLLFQEICIFCEKTTLPKYHECKSIR